MHIMCIYMSAGHAYRYHRFFTAIFLYGSYWRVASICIIFFHAICKFESSIRKVFLHQFPMHRFNGNFILYPFKYGKKRENVNQRIKLSNNIGKCSFKTIFLFALDWIGFCFSIALCMGLRWEYLPEVLASAMDK